MIVAVNMPNYGPLGTRDAVLSIAAVSEELGYESVWTTDHVLPPNSLPAAVFSNMLESLVTLGTIAAHTEQIGVGAGILVLPQRDPILAAKQAATLQHLSGGRLRLAVSVGYVEGEYEFLRAPFQRRGALLDEYLPALRELFESASPRFHGQDIQFQDVYFSPRPVTRIPLFVGGSSGRSLRRAATLGDGWYAWQRTPEQIRSGIDAIDRQQTRNASFETSLRIACRIDGDVSEGDGSHTLHGNAAEVAATVTDFRDAGVDRLVIEPEASELPDFLDQLRWFKREVEPRILDARPRQAPTP